MASPTMRYQKAASALRANLKRRKSQARARTEAAGDSSLQRRPEGQVQINAEPHASIVESGQDVPSARK